MRFLSRLAKLGLCLLLFAPLCRAQDDTVFGRQDNSESGLIGILYDLKQTQKREPSGLKGNDYIRVLDEFLASDWSESILNRYFRATRALYASQIFIPLMDAGRAPKAFGMEKVIKPSAWIVVYKGQVSPPEDGTYRFAAYADDIIAVAVNGKNVVVAGRPDTTKYLDVWKPQEAGPRVPAGNGSLVFGDWISLKKDDPVDLDVLVGERPGGQFCAFLLYEKQGAEYPKNPKGEPMLPVFQIGRLTTPRSPTRDTPPFSDAETGWTSYQ